MKQVALITGGARGIGRAISEAFAREGYLVIINYHKSKKAADSLVKSLHGEGFEAGAMRADVSSSAQVEKMTQEILDRHGRIDVLINNAAVSSQKLFTEITDKDWKSLMEVNLYGVFACCRAVLPGMICKKSGNIINISSIWGMTGASMEVHYSAAKAGVIGLTKALAKEVGPSGVRVNCLAPGVIGTDMNKELNEEDFAQLKEKTPLCRIGTPEEIAKAALFLAGEGASFITGQVLSPNGGFVI